MEIGWKKFVSILITVIFAALTISLIYFNQTYKVEGKVVELPLVGVDRANNGEQSMLVVKKLKAFGTGETFFSTEKYVDNDFQISLKSAVAFARKLTGNYGDDLIISIKSPADILGGGSAGAALAVACISALSSLDLKERVAITGTVDSDGVVGKVGRVFEKASSLDGFETIVIPKGEIIQTVNFQDCKIIDENGVRLRECVSRFKDVDLQKELRINVVEVENVEEILKTIAK